MSHNMRLQGNLCLLILTVLFRGKFTMLQLHFTCKRNNVNSYDIYCDTRPRMFGYPRQVNRSRYKSSSAFKMGMSQCFGYLRTPEIPSDMGLPFKYGGRVLIILRFPPRVPKSIVIWVPLLHANAISVENSKNHS